jgi:hypothetical protein
MPSMTKPLVVLAVGAALVLAPVPAWAHPVTGGPASSTQIAVVIAGGVLVVIGGAFTIYGDKLGAVGRKVGRKTGIPVLFLGLLGFMAGPSVVSAVDDPCADRPSTDARIEIVQPRDEATFDTTKIPLEVRVVGGTLTDAATTQQRPDEGHLHVSVDGRLVSMTGQVSETIDVPVGEHMLLVEFSAGDHGPFCPSVEEQVTIRVEE